MADEIMSITEARAILNKTADKMTDDEVADTVRNLDEIAKAAFEDVRKKRIKQDAAAMAELIYDIYQDKKKQNRA